MQVKKTVQVLAVIMLLVGLAHTATAALSDLNMSWSLNSSFDDNTNLNNLTPVSTAFISSTNPQLGNGSAFFSGTNNDGAIGDNFTIPVTRSVAAWVNTTGKTDGPLNTIFGFTNDDLSKSWYFFFTGANNSLRLTHTNTSGEGQVWTTNDSTSIQNNTWTHIVVTQQDDDPPTFYVDGVRFNGTNVSTTGTDTNPTGAFLPTRLGQVGLLDTMNGSIDEVGVWSTILTVGEVLQLYNNGTGTAFPYEDIISFEVIDEVTNNPINAFCSNITVTNTSGDLILTNQSCTSTGAINYEVNGTYNATIFSIGVGNPLLEGTFLNVTSTNLNLTTPQTVVFEAFPDNTLLLSIFDELTEEKINDTNFTVEIIGETQSFNFTVEDGDVVVENVTNERKTIRYRSANYPERDYIVNITNSTPAELNIELFALNFTESDTVITTTVDLDGNAIEGAVVQLLRFYVSCNCFKVVEMSETSFSGEAVFNAQFFEGHYKWSVDFGNVNVFFSTSSEVLVPEEGATLVERTFTINLGTDFYETFTTVTDAGGFCTFNETTGGLTFSWSDPTTTVTQGCLDAKRRVGVEFVSVGENCLAGSTGSVFLVLNDTNTTLYQFAGTLEIDSDFQQVEACTGWLTPVTTSLLEELGPFLAIGVQITLILAFSSSAIAVLVISAGGSIFLSAMGLMPYNSDFLIGFSILVLGFGIFMMRSVVVR